MPALTKRTVAVSFLFNIQPDKPPYVALFRRSGKVRTYQHKFAPISGSVEPTDASPLHTAWREIKEETNLDGSVIRFFRQGKPYTFTDESIGREWTIHPFAFTVPDEEAAAAAIKLNYEHERYAWFDVTLLSSSDLSDDFGVPRLSESFRRVWFEAGLGEDAGMILRRGLQMLQADHESGARVLGTKALQVFRDAIWRLDRSDSESWWRNVKFAGWHLWKNGRESMGASVLSVVLASLAIIEKKLPSSTGQISSELRVDVVRRIREFEEQRQSASAKTGDEFVSFINSGFPAGEEKPLRIVTLSCSSTITRCLDTLLVTYSRRLDIRILESRPLFEGVTMARRLTLDNKEDNKCRITVYTDASAAVASRDVDLVLIGADLIDASGNVSNKTGSLPTVLAARHVSPSAKVITIADKEKVLPFDRLTHDEENDVKEVSAAWPEAGNTKEGDGGIEVKNIYFEWVPASLIDLYVSEDGVLSRRDVENLARDARVKAASLFDDN